MEGTFVDFVCEADPTGMGMICAIPAPEEPRARPLDTCSLVIVTKAHAVPFPCFVAVQSCVELC